MLVTKEVQFPLTSIIYFLHGNQNSLFTNILKNILFYVPLSKSSSLSWELRTASPRGRYGERRQRDPCLKHTIKKTPLVGRRQPMTSLPARPQYKGRREDIILFFVFTDCFVWSVHSGKSTVFSLSWWALARRLRLCMDPRPRYLTPNDTHNLCVFCLGKEHAR